jgi:hypothetical protein
MAEKAFSFRAGDRRRGRPRHAAVIVVAAGIALVATACTAASSGLVAAGPTSTPPAVMVLKQGADNGNGDIFIAPAGGGPEIISNTGKVIWFHPLLLGEVATDFRTQTYQGKPVLTWWQGTGFGGLSSGTDYNYNDHYHQIAKVNAGNGYSADGHEFLITPWNTALILAYTTATANLTSIGGPADQAVTDGNLLISSRYTWTIYKVNRHTGAIMRELGGKQSTFKLKAAPGQVLDSAGEIFAYQHDPEAIGNDEYTVFDDESGGGGLLPYSRVVTVKLDLAAQVATLVKSVEQPEAW